DRAAVAFFFSSRRRHTRSKRDWSSDVCSSDLVKTSNETGIWTLYENYTMTVIGANTNSGSSIRSNLRFIAMKMTESLQLGGIERSEERRVGKECRLRRATER